MQLSLPTCEATPEHPLQLVPTLEQESLQLQNLLDSSLGEFMVNFYWLCASNNVLYSFSRYFSPHLPWQVTVPHPSVAKQAGCNG